MSKEYVLTTHRSDLEKCSCCNKKLGEDVALSYRKPSVDDFNCDIYSPCGWWIRIDFKHKFLEDNIIEKEFVKIYCPKCHEDQNKKDREFINLI